MPLFNFWHNISGQRLVVRAFWAVTDGVTCEMSREKTRKRVKMAVHPFEVDFVLSGADRAVYKTLVQRNHG